MELRAQSRRKQVHASGTINSLDVQELPSARRALA